jgi:putative FmdB family regulatory protein
MPIYEYECDNFGHRFEKFQSIQAAPLRVCEVCGGPVHRIIHPPGIIFKGSGWYITDSRKSDSAAPRPASTAAKEKPAVETSAGEKTSVTESKS